MSDSERTPEQMAHNEKMKLYMREYRKRRKLANAVQGGDNVTLHTYAVEPENAPGVGEGMSEAGSSILGASGGPGNA